MTRTVGQAFEEFHSNLIQLESHRGATDKHRASVEAALRNTLDLYLIRETGSFTHGTGVRHVRGHGKVDLAKTS